MQGFPISADKFNERLIAFGESHTVFSEKYPICRFPKLAFKEFRRAVFEKNYIFVYKEIKNEIIVFDVIHVKRLI
ncbi:MAG: hypothetical protein HW421_1694 [Ignavibacteria bacterium]|nr:hypothetical protein [Ignavibacteria bacterium]